MDLFFPVVLILLALGLLVFAAIVVIIVMVAVRRGLTEAPRPVQGPPPALRPQDFDEISLLVEQDRRIPAIKLLRETTGLGLREAKEYVDHWPERITTMPAAGTGPWGAAAPTTTADPLRTSVPEDRLRIEAAAILATSGWHTAEAFLRDQRGLTPEAARTLLDSLG